MRAVAMLAGLIALLASGDAAARGAEAEIRKVRAASNAAIARHDLAGMKAAFVADAVVLPGSSGVALDLSSMDERIGRAFADPTFVTYVRTPTRITVGRTGRRAVEIGKWLGLWRKSDGEMRMTGVYQAMWVPTPAGWRMKNESFVTLACTGSAACAGAD